MYQWWEEHGFVRGGGVDHYAPPVLDSKWCRGSKSMQRCGIAPGVVGVPLVSACELNRTGGGGGGGGGGVMRVFII